MSQLLMAVGPMHGRPPSFRRGRGFGIPNSPPTAVCSLNPAKRRHQDRMLAFATADISQSLSEILKPSNRNQLAIGTAVGFATGYAIKRVGQVLLVFVGLEVIALQLMSNQGWVIVNWPLISRDLSPHVEKGAMDRVLDALTRKLPFAGSFTAGCYAGLNWS